MRIFIVYKNDGQILSVSKLEVMPEKLEQLYTTLDKDEAVLEIPAKGNFLKLDAIELHTQYKIDVTKKKLVKKK